MPTGYTADVQSGKITKFSDFALRCARAMGALIEMRDEPMDATIPKKLGGARNDYQEHELKKAQERLAKLEGMSPEKAEKEATKANKAKMDAHLEYEAAKAKERARYEAMLEKARAWSPPTTDHQGLKDFMCSQLSESIDFDCFKSEAPKPETGAEWLKRELASAKRDMAHHTEEILKAKKRGDGRQEWLDQLRKSLAA